MNWSNPGYLMILLWAYLPSIQTKHIQICISEAGGVPPALSGFSAIFLSYVM
jgi:hypothetical protein